MALEQDHGHDHRDRSRLSGPAVVSAAFYVIVDGFPANELGITAATFIGTPNMKPSISFGSTLKGMKVKATACSAPDESNLNIVQRFTWTFLRDARTLRLLTALPFQRQARLL